MGSSTLPALISLLVKKGIINLEELQLETKKYAARGTRS